VWTSARRIGVPAAFPGEGKLSAAACIRRHAIFVAGIVAATRTDDEGSRKNNVTITIGNWRK
jgi:hypothetical protein